MTGQGVNSLGTRLCRRCCALAWLAILALAGCSALHSEKCGTRADSKSNTAAPESAISHGDPLLQVNENAGAVDSSGTKAIQQNSAAEKAPECADGSIRPVAWLGTASEAPEVLPEPKAVERELPALTLDQVINATLLADPKLRAGFQLINEAKGEAWTASLKPNPYLYVDTQLLPLTRAFTPTKQGGPPQTDVYLSYRIDWFLFGKRAARMRAAALHVRSSEAAFADLIRVRVLEAATVYYDVLEAKGLLNVAQQVVANYERVEAVTAKAVAGGGRPRVELNRIRLNLLKSRQVMRIAAYNLVAAKARLKAIMGQSSLGFDFDLAGTLDDQPKIQPLPLGKAFDIAQENRPDIHALRWNLDAARADIVSEDRKAYPEVTPLAGYTRQYQKNTIGYPDASSYIVAFTTSLPLYNRNQGNRAKARAYAAQSDYLLRHGLIALEAEIVQVSKELQIAAANARAVAEEQLTLARQVRDSLNKAYAAGGRPLIDVLNAQNSFQQTFQLYVTTRANYGRALVKYYATLGRRVTTP